MSNKIQIKRGIKANLPILDAGEPAFTTDTKQFFVGDGSSNIEFAKQGDLEITNKQLLDLKYKVAQGTATQINIPALALEDGTSKTFIASANNAGVAGPTPTTINGKPLYKPNTKIAPNLIAGKAYTVWYNSIGDCFFIKASAEGDAIAANVLAGKKFSNDDDTGITGTMINNGKMTITPTTANQIISDGYHNGSGYVLGDSELISANIKAGANIFNVDGKQSVVDTVEATANAGYILNGETAYVKGSKVTGNIPNNYGVWQESGTPASAKDGVRLHMYPPKGYYDPAGGTGVYYDDKEFIASNILSTANIFGLQGSATIGSLGGKRINQGSFKLTTNSNKSVTTTADIGFIPSIFIVWNGESPLKQNGLIEIYIKYLGIRVAVSEGLNDEYFRRGYISPLIDSMYADTSSTKVSRTWTSEASYSKSDYTRKAYTKWLAIE